MPIYELHEVTSIGDSANIDLNSPKSATAVEYSKTEQGTFIVDKNMDLSNSRRIISLNVTKSSQKKFNQVIDIEFKEFTLNANDPSRFLENKLQSLEEDRSKLIADADRNIDLINRLQAEIDALRAVNKIPDTLNARDVLYADRQGRKGDPGYPRIENKLLSANRKAIGIIQNDGKFVIYLGNFDEFGNEILNPNEPSQLTAISSFGSNQDSGTPGLKIQISGGNGNLIVFRLGNNRPSWQAFPNFQPLSYAAKLVLSDNGILTLYDGAEEKWSTKNLDPSSVTGFAALKVFIEDALKPWFTSSTIVPPGGDPFSDTILIDGEIFNLNDAAENLYSSIEFLRGSNKTDIDTIEQTVRNSLSPYITYAETIDRAAPGIAFQIKEFIG